ncbi:MAG: peptidase [Kordia sp.]|nr:MAG: peptidase [Kordia sp.]
MKKTTLKVAMVIVTLAGVFSVNAQQKQLVATADNFSDRTFEITETTKQAIKETGYARCLSVENEAILQANNSNRMSSQEFENWLAPRVAKIKADILAGKTVQAVYNIPVVIHIVHNGDAVNTPGNLNGENISDAQALSQINVMNQDYRRLVSTPGGANSTGVAVDVEINFCMAQTDPSGNLTNGVVRHNITPYNNNVADGAGGVDWETRADVETMKAATQWDPTLYLNMWTFRPGGLPLSQGGFQGLLGYAQFPDNTPNLGGLNATGGTAATDGVTAGFDAFGTIAEDDGSFLMNGTYNLGRTMTHEVGHWLGLRHIWGDGNAYDPTGVNGTVQGSCPVDDFCNDTPNARAANYSCVSNNNCGAGAEQVQNYMDYTNDACMDTFTADQKIRMQAVMAQSPRRMELNTSTRCQAPTPLVSYNALTQTINEGSDCGYTDVTVTLKIGKAPTATATATVLVSGTATANDYQFSGGNTVTFPAGQIADKTVTIRVVNDGFVEGNETLILDINVANGGGDAVVTTENTKQQTITIVDNDAVSNALTVTPIFTYTTDVTGWVLINADGNSTWGNYNSGLNDVGVIEPNFLGSQAVTADNTTNDYMISPSFIIPAGVASLSINHALLSLNGNQNYELYFATDTTNSGTIQAGTLLSSGVATAYAASPSLETLNLSPVQVAALSGATGSLVLRHTETANNNGYLLWDTIAFSATTATSVQTALNSGTPDPNVLSTSGTIYTANTANGNVMADITNTSGVNYGCVNTYVSRATGASVMYQVAGVANYVMGKTFAITPGTPQVGGNATLKFYFTEAEITEWETTTGNNRSTLAIIKNNGSSETVVATIGAFGGDVTLSGTFASGINGTYYFGKMESVLGVAENQFNILSVYPNPSSNGIFNLSVSTTDDTKVKLFDIRGRNVYSKLHTNNSDVFNTTLDFSSLASGVYILDIESGYKRAVKKIVIQ